MKMINKFLSVAVVAATLPLAVSAANAKVEKNIDGSVHYKRAGGAYQAYKINPQVDKLKYKAGRTATKNEIKAWDIDIMPDGTGLPEGKGNIDDGEELYNAKCSMCHGDFGTGGKGYPTLSGGEKSSLKNQLLKSGDEPPERSIGSYWPYASTLFWYVKTGMPFPHPMSLSNDEAYSITAYLLNVNDVTFKDGSDIEELSKATFKNIKMPNADGFYPDVDGPKAKENMKALLAHPEKYGKGTRCMKNCIKGKVPVVRIDEPLEGFNPPLTEVRDMPKKKASSKEDGGVGAKIYAETCKACHGNPAIGAPVLGDKAAWAKVIKQGKDKVYEHALKGFKGMPAKGGNTALSDADVKATVDYIIGKSK